MSYPEFAYFIIGLSHETPLGRIIAVRAENDPKVIKEFTPQQRKIRNDYRTKMAKKKSKESVASTLEGLQKAFVAMAKDENA